MLNIPVSEPNLCGNEKAYLLDCLDSTRISSKGKYVDQFEELFSEYIGVKHAVTTSNGTVSLHLILRALGIGPGDEVIVPCFSYVASANSVLYVGADPVFVDCDARTWNMDVEAVERAITERTRAIMAVHLYGGAVDMGPLRRMCQSRNIGLIEDAAEAVGTQYNGVKAGALGDVASFSFFANKTITTGEGGMITTDDDSLAQLIRRLKNQGESSGKTYWHDVLGYNYRMTNLQAAIGLAQMENIDTFVEKKRTIADTYRNHLLAPEIQHPVEQPGTVNSYWMYSILLKGLSGTCRDEFMEMLGARGIETRPFFYPMHTLPIYRDRTQRSFPVAEDVASRGINLPSSTKLTEPHVIHVCDMVNETLEEIKSRYG